MTQSATTAVYKGNKSGQVIPNRVFVGGIDPTATVEELTGLFNKYGNVTNCRIVSNPNGASKGYGFVTFEKADDVPRLYNDVSTAIKTITYRREA